MCHFNGKGVQINEFVWISKLSDKMHYLTSWPYTIMFLQVALKQLHGWPILLQMVMCFFTHCTRPASLRITQAFHLLLDFTENQIVLCNFTIRNSVRITEDSDNEDLDNQGSTVLKFL